MQVRNWFAKLFLAAVAALTSAGAATAGLLPVSVTVIPEGDNYRWTYAIVLPTDSKLQSGNYFTIYDFHGYVAGGESAPDGWQFTATKTGPTPNLLKPNDDPDVYNLTWKYTGATIPSGQIGLGNFWALSTMQDANSDSFTAQTNRTSDGLLDNNITETDVPKPTTGGGGTTLTPEPTTLLMAGLGLPLLGFARRRRKSA